MSDVVTVAGVEVEPEHIKRLPNGGARFDFKTETKRWRVDITRAGNTEIVTTWKDDQLADLDEPEWLDDVVAMIATAQQ